MSPEPVAFARCAAIGDDRPSLARCTRLSRAQRLILGEELAEGAQRAVELQELLGDVARARAAAERLRPPPGPRVVAVRPPVDLAGALAEIPDRRSRVRAAGGGSR